MKAKTVDNLHCNTEELHCCMVYGLHHQGWSSTSSHSLQIGINTALPCNATTIQISRTNHALHIASMNTDIHTIYLCVWLYNYIHQQLDILA